MVERWMEKSDLWKDGALFLQHRLRDRFRVAVDRHRRRSRLSEGYLSSTMQRWLQRFRSFGRESFPPSSSFYRKRVSKDLDAEDDSVLTRALQAVAVPVIGNVCHVFMHGLNCVRVYGAEKLHEPLLNRPENKPLITVSNHVASVDDPFVIASLLPSSVLMDARHLRWTLCATDRCFTNPVTSAFFKYVKVLPVSRGEGIYQKGMDIAISKLNRGGWVHIFPEGSRSRDGGRTVGSVKRGIGRLVLDTDNVPVVLPFVHTGMQEIMPIGAKFPRIGKTVTVLIGDPIDFTDIRDLEENESLSRGNLYDAVSTRIGNRLNKLKAQVDRLALEQSLQIPTYHEHCQESSTPTHDIGFEEKREFLYKPDEECFNRYIRMGFSYDGGIVSRIRSYMDPTELMGFAARGIFMDRGTKENTTRVGGASLMVWSNIWKNVSEPWQVC